MGSGPIRQAKFGWYLSGTKDLRSICQTEKAVEWEQISYWEQVLPTVLPRKQLTWVLIEFSVFPKIRIILTELFSKWSHCHDFDYYSLLPAKIIKWKGLSHMYSYNSWIHLKWKFFSLLNSKTTQWVINEFWRRVSIIRISTHWVVFEVKRYASKSGMPRSSILRGQY
jgi:hypothetical protein